MEPANFGEHELEAWPGVSFARTAVVPRTLDCSRSNRPGEVAPANDSRNQHHFPEVLTGRQNAMRFRGFGKGHSGINHGLNQSVRQASL